MINELQQKRCHIEKNRKNYDLYWIRDCSLFSCNPHEISEDRRGIVLIISDTTIALQNMRMKDHSTYLFTLLLNRKSLYKVM